MNGTIHIIDDDTGVRSALQRVLEAAGWRTRCYAAAGDYLLPAPDPAPGCLLLDVQLPGFSGLDLQEALPRRKRRSRSISTLTSSTAPPISKPPRAAWCAASSSGSRTSTSG